MKRKLIDFDTFQQIREGSLTNRQAELEGAADLLARVFDVDGLALESYTDGEVLFESADGEFIKAKYDISGGYVKFDDVEQLVINEETEEKSARQTLSNMLDALIESDEAKAEAFFSEWMNMPRTHRLFSENVRGKKQSASTVRKRMKSKMVNNKKMTPAERKRRKAFRSKVHVGNNERRVPIRKSKDGKVKITGWKKVPKNKWSIKKNMQEWSVIAENVLGFVDLQVNGPNLDKVQTLVKDGEIVAVKVPTMALRNEARLLKFDWKTMNTDVVVKRRESKKMHESEEFTKSVANLKRLNALSDGKEFATALENAVTEFPGVVYLTEEELASEIKMALEAVGATNFDDETCLFISEGLLRTAHDTFVDRISKIVRLAGGKINEEAEDKYAGFRSIADAFFARLDEGAELEMQAYVDVYESLRSVYDLAREEGNEDIANETANHLDDLLQIVSGKAEMDVDTLGDAAEWLYDVAEATQPEDWKADSPHVTADGEHPVLAGKAKKYQSPAEMQGSTPEYHHTSDGKGANADAARELGEEGWSNIGGEGVYPSLDNPYVPKSEAPGIKGEKSVESDSGQLAHWSDDETWPNLSNPYLKASATPKSVEE